MKVYVDELPKKCEDCPFFNLQDGYCSQQDMHLDFDFRKDTGIDIDCPLQSLSDYTKQVRNEVCEEIKDKMIMYGKKTLYNDCGDAIGIYECLSLNEIKNVLDQIQGE